MKKFVFRLEKVLHFRRLVKDEKKRELSKRLALLHDGQMKLEALEAAQLANILESEQLLHAEYIIMRGLYAVRLKAEIASQKQLISELEAAADEARAEYIEASKEVEVLEKLKARKKEEYIHEMDLQEGKMLDEFGIQRNGKDFF